MGVQLTVSTLYQQYRDGKCEEVWDKLYSLKDLVNDDRYLPDARAVAAETMKRARHNVELILARLDKLGYKFALPRGTVFSPPPANVDEELARVQEEVGTFPLSLEAWYEHVGCVSFVGDHPTLSSHFHEIKVDGVRQTVNAMPLEVLPLDYAERSFAENRENQPNEPPLFLISCPIDDYEGIEVPNEGADGIYTLTGDRFVEYLRLSFRWGGFPGWRSYQTRPEKELKHLTEGLLAI
jgi:hypothetical protein